MFIETFRGGVGRIFQLFNPSGVKVTTELEADLLNLSGSSVHLGKSFFNLLSNAAEAMPGGGTVTVKTANHYLDQPLSGFDRIREGDYVVLTITDTGEGISGSDLKRIFEPFYTKKVMGRSGTGLGLAVVWGTVKDQHGYINVESKPDRGTTFIASCLPDERDGRRRVARAVFRKSLFHPFIGKTSLNLR